jgi:hypothetical protein
MVVHSAVALRREEIQFISETVTVGRNGYLISEQEMRKGRRTSSCWCSARVGVSRLLAFSSPAWVSVGGLSSRFYLTTAVVGYAITGAVVLIGLNHARRFGFSDAVTTVFCHQL